MKKRLIILCDGTWNNLEMRYKTNVGLLSTYLPDGIKVGEQNMMQKVEYDPGVGSSGGILRKLWEGAFGRGLEKNVQQVYAFLVENYREGDEVCLFGFSRGAYTVRSLAGMIQRVGLLKAGATALEVKQAWRAYRKTKKKKKKEGEEEKKKREQENEAAWAAFREEHDSQPCPIKLLGCWDTVGAKGLPDKVSWLSLDKAVNAKYAFHNTTLGPHIENALHAVAIHERRKEFIATLMKSEVSREGASSTNLKQVWFPGDHCCVGGGVMSKRGLSNRCLRWMLEEAASLGVDLGMRESIANGLFFNEDHSIYFHNQESPVFSTRERTYKIPEEIKSLEELGDIHDSARRRFQELHSLWGEATPAYFLKNQGQPVMEELRRQFDDTRSLARGEEAHVCVFADRKKNPSRVQVHPGERYRFTVGRAQVWKDGSLDPCSIMGWNIEHMDKNDPKAPRKDDEVVSNFIINRMIRLARKYKLVQEADWFELIVSTDGKAFEKLDIHEPDAPTENYVITYEATREGELHFAANDASSGMIDKFDNNQGWVWVKIERVD